MEYDDLILLLVAVGTIVGAGVAGLRKGFKELLLTLACVAAGAGLGYFVDGTRAATVVAGAAGALGPSIYRLSSQAVTKVKIAKLLKDKNRSR